MVTIKNSKGVVLRVPKSTLEACGYVSCDDTKREIIKLEVSRSPDNGSRLEDVFANYYPSDRRAEAYLGRLGSSKTDHLALHSARQYNLASFVKDFDRTKPLNLANLALESEGGDVWMEVDGSRLQLSDCRLATFGSMVNLVARIEEKSPEIKFEYDGKSSAARFKGHPLIEFIQINGDELSIRYAQSKDERHVYTMNLKGG